MFPTNKIYTTPKQSLHRHLADCYSGPAELRRMYRNACSQHACSVVAKCLPQKAPYGVTKDLDVSTTYIF